MTRAPRTFLAVAILLVLALTAPASAQRSDPRTEREQTRAKRAQVARQLDALRANDQQLSQAVADLDAHIATQSSKVAAARQAVAAAEAELAEAQRRLAET
jgi:septal ring factor EnvC (AmiA/AmiB activator)